MREQFEESIADRSFAACGRGGLGFRAGGLTATATRVVSARSAGGKYTATLATSDPLGRRMTVTLSRAASGVIEVRAVAPSGADAVTLGFDPAAGQRFLGFGERSDAVVRNKILPDCPDT